MSDHDGTDIAKIPFPVVAAGGKAVVPRNAVNAHIAARHVDKGLQDLAVRMNPLTGAPIKHPSTFPNGNAAGAALGKPNFPNIPAGGQAEEFLCNEFCGWGIRANAKMSARQAQQAMNTLQNKLPDAAAWTLPDLKDHGLEFVITKHAKAVHGRAEASLFPIIDHSAKDILVNDAALGQLQCKTLQEAINPNGPGWKAVSESSKINTVNPASAGGQEKVVLARGDAAKWIGRTIVFILVMVETAFFVAKFSSAPNKIAHTAEYVANVALIIGGYFACEAAGTAMAVAGYGSLAIAGASLGIGLVFAAVGFGISMLISWLARPYELSIWRSDLFAEEALFVQSEPMPGHVFVGQSGQKAASVDDKRIGLMAGAPGFRTSRDIQHDIAVNGKHYLSGMQRAPHMASSSTPHYLSSSTASAHFSSTPSSVFKSSSERPF